MHLRNLVFTLALGITAAHAAGRSATPPETADAARHRAANTILTWMTANPTASRTAVEAYRQANQATFATASGSSSPYFQTLSMFNLLESSFSSRSPFAALHRTLAQDEARKRLKAIHATCASLTYTLPAESAHDQYISGAAFASPMEVNTLLMRSILAGVDEAVAQGATRDVDAKVTLTHLGNAVGYDEKLTAERQTHFAYLRLAAIVGFSTAREYRTNPSQMFSDLLVTQSRSFLATVAKNPTGYGFGDVADLKWLLEDRFATTAVLLRDPHALGCLDDVYFYRLGLIPDPDLARRAAAKKLEDDRLAASALAAATAAANAKKLEDDRAAALALTTASAAAQSMAATDAAAAAAVQAKAVTEAVERARTEALRKAAEDKARAEAATAAALKAAQDKKEIEDAAAAETRRVQAQAEKEAEEKAAGVSLALATFQLARPPAQMQFTMLARTGAKATAPLSATAHDATIVGAISKAFSESFAKLTITAAPSTDVTEEQVKKLANNLNHANFTFGMTSGRRTLRPLEFTNAAQEARNVFLVLRKLNKVTFTDAAEFHRLSNLLFDNFVVRTGNPATTIKQVVTAQIS